MVMCNMLSVAESVRCGGGVSGVNGKRGVGGWRDRAGLLASAMVVTSAASSCFLRATLSCLSTSNFSWADWIPSDVSTAVMSDLTDEVWW